MTVKALTIPMFMIHHHKIGGTESAIYNLVHGLAETDIRLTLAYADAGRFSPEFQGWLARNPQVRHKKIAPLPGPKNSRFLEETMFEWQRSDEEWAVYPNYFLPPRLKKRPTAVILHDIQYKILPQFHSSKRRAWLDFYLPRMFSAADVVLLISESEKNYIAQHFGAKAAEKCRVIYNAIGWSRFDGPAISERVKALAAQPYILTVSHPFPHKNLSTLIKAFDRFAQEMPELKLYLAGKDSEDKRRMIVDNASPEVRERILPTGVVSDAELGLLYRNARLFALPSIYEGFGMPATEAMGLGIPTLVSGVTSLPEATLHRANYVADPLDVGQWADAMLSLIRSGVRPSPDDVAAIHQAFSPKTVAERLISMLPE